MSSQDIKVLLVEDNPGDARLVREMLHEGGEAEFSIAHVEQLGEALERLGEERFDVILLDLSLPDSHGLDTFIKVHDRASEVPILVSTGLDDEALGVKAVQEGAQDYLVKGQVDGKSLLRSVRYAIERSKLSAERLHDAKRQRTGKVLGFIGAKGGVGTTTVALNVASALAQQEKRVIALELRPYHGTFSQQMNQTPVDSLGNLLELAPERIDERELSMRLSKTPFGLDLLFSPRKTGEFKEMDPDKAEAVVKGLAGMADYTVVDFPCHPSTATQAAIRLCDSVGLIVEPEPVCVKSAKVTLEVLASWGVSGSRVGVVVVNRTALPIPVSLGAIKSRLDSEIIGVVPHATEAFMAAQQAGAPIVVSQPISLAATCLSELADRLVGDKPVAMRF